MRKSRIIGICTLPVLPLVSLILAGAPAQGATAKKAPWQGTAPFATQKAIRPLIPITVSYSAQSADYVYLFAAINDGLFAREGLTVTPVLLQSAPGIAAIIDGQAKFALIGGGDTMSAIAGGAQGLRWIGTADTYSNYRFWTVPSITSGSQLSGTTIASTSASGTSTICSRLVMDHFGITNYKIAYLGSVTNDVAAVLAGSAQSMCANPPGDLVFAPAGLHLLWNLEANHVLMAQSGVVATQTEINEQPGLVQRFVTALTAGMQQMHKTAKADNLADRSILVQITGGAVTQGQSGYTMQYERQVQSGNLTPVAADLAIPQKYAEVAIPAVANINLNTFIDASFAKSAAKAVYGNNAPPVK